MISLDKIFINDELVKAIGEYSKKNNYLFTKDQNGSLYQIPPKLIFGSLQESFTLFDDNNCRYRLFNFLMNKDVGDGSFNEYYNRDSILFRQVDKKLIFHNQHHQIVVSGIDLDNEPRIIRTEDKSIYDIKDPLASYLYSYIINNNNLNKVQI